MEFSASVPRFFFSFTFSFSLLDGTIGMVIFFLVLLEGLVKASHVVRYVDKPQRVKNIVLNSNR